jgi:N-acyl-D-amino-acid deacylase
MTTDFRPGEMASAPRPVTTRTIPMDRHVKERIWWGWIVATLVLLLQAAVFAEDAKPQAATFPGEEWEVANSPESAGWSAEKLQAAWKYAESINTAAVLVVQGGRIVDQWGETERPFNCHSMRKSILSALYGIHVAEGTIDLDKTLDELGIDDNEPSLTDVERAATVRDLIKARSGIYHSALYETAAMAARRPERGSHEPGQFWYYNNWDFNALGTIFHNVTARSVFEDFEHRLAGPLGMQDFDREKHSRFVTGRDSVHPAYPFTLSARDLARFGLLFARNGRWHDEQIIPEEWVTESTTSYSEAGTRGGYGYMWWIAQEGRHYPHADVPDGAFSARGAGGHCLLVVPEWDLVVAHRVNTFRRNNQVSADEQGRLIGLILQARPRELAESSLRTRPPELRSDESQAVAFQEPEYDLLLSGGRVMDGTGNPWFRADVAVRDGRIVAVGRLNPEDARRTIDVTGRIVAPGFIDMHSHADRGLTSSNATRRSAPNLVTQGITTVVINQDGFGPSSIKEQLETMQELGVGLNVIQLIGHGGIRRAVMGRDHQRPATDEEVEEMLGLLRDALDLGAFGMSAGLEYVPGRWSTTEEIKALVAELAKEDHVYIVHERSSGADPMWYLPSRDGPGSLTMIDNIVELIDVAESTGAKVVATHIKARGKHFWGSSRVMIHMIDEARQRGVRIYADQYPYNTSGSDGSIVLLPSWLSQRVKLASEDDSDAEDPTPADRLEAALQDEELLGDLKRDTEHEIIRRGGPEQIVIMDHPDEELVGLSLGDAARKREITPLEMVFELQLKGNRGRNGGARLRSYSMSEMDVEAFAAQPWTATCTDGGIALLSDSRNVHPRYYGAFPRKIRRYAIDLGTLTIEDAVRSSTSLPAQILGLRDRGQVREGFHADLVAFDPERIRDKATADDPHQYSEGIDYVLVGGTLVVKEGEPTGTLAGRVIQKR